ncbi:MAG: branched-chain amino acid ABC transporter permease [Anaerolineae bacterium]
MEAKKRPFWLQSLLDNWVYLAIVAFLVVFPHVVGWLTDSSPFGVPRGSRVIMRGESAFWQAVFIEIFALSILVMSYNLMFGFTGVISFGHALFFGVGGFTIGMLWEYTEINGNAAFILGIVITLGLTSVIGFLIGLVSLRLRGVYYAIFTLAVAEMAFIFIGRWPVTNGEDGFTISRLPAWIDPSQSRLNVYYFGLALFVLAFLVIRRLVKSPTGTVFQAIRENEERAQAIGYNTLRYKLLSITAASMMAGLAGFLHAILNKKLGPEMFAVSFTVDSLLMTIIGGVGTFVGPVVGATSLHLADTVFRDAVVTIGGQQIDIGDSWLLILGLIFIVVVMIFPQGIVGTWLRFRLWFSRTYLQRNKSGGRLKQAAEPGMD